MNSWKHFSASAIIFAPNSILEISGEREKAQSGRGDRQRESDHSLEILEPSESVGLSSVKRHLLHLVAPMRLRVQSLSRTRLRITASIAFSFRARFKGVLDTIAPQFLDILGADFAYLVDAFVWWPCPMLARYKTKTYPKENEQGWKQRRKKDVWRIVVMHGSSLLLNIGLGPIEAGEWNLLDEISSDHHGLGFRVVNFSSGPKAQIAKTLQSAHEKWGVSADSRKNA